MLLGQMLLHLLPAGGYEKYVRILFRLMILVQLILPFLSLGNGNAEALFLEQVKTLETQMEQIGRELETVEFDEVDYEKEELSAAVQEKLADAAAQQGVGIDKAERDGKGDLRIWVSEKKAENAKNAAERENDAVAENEMNAESRNEIEQIHVEEIHIDNQHPEEIELKEKNETLTRTFADLLEISTEKLEVIWND